MPAQQKGTEQRNPLGERRESSSTPDFEFDEDEIQDSIEGPDDCPQFDEFSGEPEPMDSLILTFDEMRRKLMADLREELSGKSKKRLDRFFSEFRECMFDFENGSSPAPQEDDEPEEVFEPSPQSSPEQTKSPDLKKLLMEKLGSGSSRKPAPVHYDISKTISVDSSVLNFGAFYPEKLLGSILMVQNLTDEEQVVELSIDTKAIFDCDKVIA
jgi:hypothetical protein